MAWKPAAGQLERIARNHIRYECQCLVYQVSAQQEWKRSTLAKNPAYDALIEASLVHVRVFDDFFRTPAGKRERDKDDVTAQHYLGTWSPQPILTAQERGRVNAQLHHLAGRRVAQHPWELVEFRARCASAFTKLVDGLRDAGSESAAWFVDGDAMMRPFSR